MTKIWRIQTGQQLSIFVRAFYLCLKPTWIWQLTASECIIKILVKGHHPTAGFQLTCTNKILISASFPENKTFVYLRPKMQYRISEGPWPQMTFMIRSIRPKSIWSKGSLISDRRLSLGTYLLEQFMARRSKTIFSLYFSYQGSTWFHEMKKMTSELHGFSKIILFHEFCKWCREWLLLCALRNKLLQWLLTEVKYRIIKGRMQYDSKKASR